MIRVYYKIGATKTFARATGWDVDSDGYLTVIQEFEEGDPVILALVNRDAWETVVDPDLIDAKFPSPPGIQYDSGVVIPNITTAPPGTETRVAKAQRTQPELGE